MLQPLRGKVALEEDPRSRGWPGPAVLPSRCRVSRKAFNYTTHDGFAGSNSTQNTHGVVSLGRCAKLLERARQVLGERLDFWILGVDQAKRGRRPGLAGDPL